MQRLRNERSLSSTDATATCQRGCLLIYRLLTDTHYV